MSRWAYRALRVEPEAGRVTVLSGERRAETAAHARAALRSDGLVPFEARAVGTTRRMGRSAGDRWWRTGAARAARADALEGLALMLEAGVDPVEAAGLLARPGPGRSGPERRFLRALRDDLEDGLPLSQACADRPGWFGVADRALLAAGERSGTVARALRLVAVRWRAGSALRTRLAHLLIAPAMTGATALGTWVFLGTVTLPRLIATLEGAGVPAPWITLAVASSAAAVTHNWPLLAGLGAGAAALAASAGRLARPIPARCLPEPLRRGAAGRYLLQLADLLDGEVPLPEAVALAAAGCASTPLAGLHAIACRAGERVRQGHPLADTLADQAWFGPELARMIDAGAAAGEVPPILRVVGRRWLESAGRRIDRATALLEPFMVLALAGITGLLALSAILPVVRLQGSLP